LTRRLGLKLGVRGLMNVQFAIQNDTVYVLEVNPRASRTVPFVSKATECRWRRWRRGSWRDALLRDQGVVEDLTVEPRVRQDPVFPFMKFPGSDILLGPEMKSTGEVMGSRRISGSPSPSAGRGGEHDTPGDPGH